MKDARRKEVGNGPLAPLVHLVVRAGVLSRGADADHLPERDRSGLAKEPARRSMATQPMEPFAVNGRGLTVGKDVTNGNGLTNGIGVINGCGMTQRDEPSTLPQRSQRPHIVEHGLTNGKMEGQGDGMEARADLINGLSIKSEVDPPKKAQGWRLRERKKRAMLDRLARKSADPLPGSPVR